MAAIRVANHRPDRVAAMRVVTAGAVLALGVAGFGLGPWTFVSALAALLVAEAAIELNRSAPQQMQERT